MLSYLWLQQICHLACYKEREENMKLQKMSRRLLAAGLMSVMLLSSTTVFAADKPDKKTSGQTWGDIFAIMAYVGEKTYDRYDAGELDYADDIEKDSHYVAPGTLLVSAPKEQTYCAYIEGGGVYAENQGEESDALTGDALSSYSNFYDAGMAFVDSVTTADGKYYTDDIIGTYDNFWTGKDGPFWAKVNSGQIISVASEDEAPDVATMSRGTYWVLESDLDAYEAAIQSAIAVSDTWDAKWEADNGRSLVERTEVQQCITKVTNAYNTILGKLHEGIKSEEEDDDEDILTPVESGPVSSSNGSRTEKESAPVIQNEVTFSNGAKVQSGLKGVYSSSFVAGCVYQGEPAQISQTVGLSEAEIKRGVVVKYYICNSLNKTMNATLSQAVSEQGYKVMGVMNNDLYILDNGSIRKIRTIGEALTVVLGIPENLRSEQYEFVIMCYDENGNLVTMQDVDTDKATITVKSMNFGYWAIGYRTKK